MKRTNLVLDEQLLKTATQLLGAHTYSQAVNMALQEAVRVAQIRGLSSLIGTGVWSGDLTSMREDQPSRGKQKKTSKK